MGVVEPGALGHFSLLFHHRQSLHSYPVLMMVVMSMTMVLVTMVMVIMVIMVMVIPFFSSVTGQSQLLSRLDDDKDDVIMKG